MELIQKENGFYYIDNFEELAYITYYIEDNILYVDHTFVDSSLRGKGIASKLVMRAIEFVKENDYKIVPICSYVVDWFNKNQEYQNLLK